METFNLVAEVGRAELGIISGGVSEALVATATGLLVAIVAVFFYNSLVQKVDATLFEIEHIVQSSLELLELESNPPGAIGV